MGDLFKNKIAKLNEKKEDSPYLWCDCTLVYEILCEIKVDQKSYTENEFFESEINPRANSSRNTSEVKKAT